MRMHAAEVDVERSIEWRHATSRTSRRGRSSLPPPEARSRANQILRGRIRSPAVSPRGRGRPRVSIQEPGGKRLAYRGDDDAPARGEGAEARGWHSRRRIRRISLAEPRTAGRFLRAELQAYEASARSLFKARPLEWVA